MRSRYLNPDNLAVYLEDMLAKAESNSLLRSEDKSFQQAYELGYIQGGVKRVIEELRKAPAIVGYSWNLGKETKKGRRKTVKHLRYQTICCCGHNSVDDRREPTFDYTHDELIKMGYKRKKWKDGTVYYLLLNDTTGNTLCDGHADEEESDDN